MTALLSDTPTGLLFMLLTPLTLAGTWMEDRLRGRRAHREAFRALRSELGTAKERLRAARTAAQTRFAAQHPPPERLLPIVLRRENLWCRTPYDADFLEARVGVSEGPAPWSIEPEADPGTMETGHGTRTAVPRTLAPLIEELTRLRIAAGRLPGTPITIPLSREHMFGITGSPSRMLPTLNAFLTQIVSQHSPADLVLCGLIAPSLQPWLSWLRWLPHVDAPGSPIAAESSDHAGPATTSHFATDMSGARDLLHALKRIAGAREAAHRRKHSAAHPRIVCIVTDPLEQSLEEILKLALPELGLHLIWISAEGTPLPGDCTKILRIATQTELLGTGARGLPESRIRLQQADKLPLNQATRVAFELCPLRDLTHDATTTVIPESVALGELFDTGTLPTPEDILRRWRSPNTLTRPVHAPVGHDGAGRVLIDLQRDGPHALVAGTTGSGKSELLQTWVLSLCASTPPEQLTFLLIDYKGGSAFHGCSRLPHTIGMITDLDAHLVDRALGSLRAELHLRERLLAEHGAKDLDALRRVSADTAPPRLIIVVDEFAALARERPTFLEGIVDLGARGRSLGIHLILGTQRPAGVVSEHLRANTNLRISLRTASELDSIDVLGTPQAASITSRTPGRALLRIGSSSPRVLQTAYGGRPATSGEVSSAWCRPYPFGIAMPSAPPAGPAAPRPAAGTPEAEPTQAEALIERIRAAAGTAGSPAPHRPWLDPLPTRLPLQVGVRDPASRRRDRHRIGALLLGLCDRPEQQSQPVYSPTLESLGGVLVCGAGGSGRTSALRSLIVQATTDPGEPVWAYAVDASGALADLTVLPGVGSVTRASDRAGTLRLLRWIEGQIEARARAFEATGANTLTEYRAHSGRPLPRLLLCLDSFEEAEELLPPSREQDPCAVFTSCAVRGRRLGIHAAVCASRPSRLPSELRSVLKTVFPLRQQDAASAGSCGAPDHFGDPSHPPGRTWVDGAEIQLGLLNPGALSRLTAQAAGRLLPATVPPSPPARLVLDELTPAEDGRPTIGVDLETLQPLGIPPTGVLLVQGRTGSGRTTALRTLRDALLNSRPGARRLLFTPHRGELSTDPGWDQIFEGVDAVNDGIRAHLLASRSGDILVVERAADLAETPAGEVLGQLLHRYGHGTGSVLMEISGPELRGAWALANAVREPGAALLLDPPPGEALGEPGSEAPLERPVSRRPGVGILVERGRARHLLVALPGDTASEQLLPGLHPESYRQEGSDHKEHRPHEL
ncbi:MAG: hypothetical protein LKF88_00485 [Microbacteriaceae bacterium]|nr:hypothetical protein [Microbacteriaceae bacterium]MCI1207707.1 hypothetical protein [Microbacteriaceae bacterium]